jgi:hypothetical protein
MFTAKFSDYDPDETRERRMNIDLMQPSLRTKGGHPYNETVGWVDACKKRGIALRVFVLKNTLPEILEETGATCVFGITEADIAAYCRPEDYAKTRDPYCQPLLEFMVTSRAMTRACREAWTPPRPDIIVFPWAFPTIMNGVAEWLTEIPASERPGFVFNFVRPEEGWQLDTRRKQATGNFMLFRFATKRLNALLPPERLKYTAADKRLCNLIAHAAQAECGLAPLPISCPPQEELARLREPGRGGIRIGLLGQNRGEKGGGLYAQIIEAVCKARSDVSFFVQVRKDADAQELSAALRGLPVRAAIHAGQLPREDYFARMVNSDLLLMPYTGANYAMQASGIFAEGISCGVPGVVPAGTWMSDRLKEGFGAGEIFAQANPREIAAATLRAISRLPELSVTAAQCMEPWRRQQSVAAYVDYVAAQFSARPK